MPAITPELLRDIEELTEQRLAIYADGPWEAQVTQDLAAPFNWSSAPESIRIEVRGQRGSVSYELNRWQVEQTDVWGGLLNSVIRGLENQVQEYLRANPPPAPREVLDFYAREIYGVERLPSSALTNQEGTTNWYLADGQDIRPFLMLPNDMGNKIDTTVKPDPDAERKSSWQRILGDNLV